MHDDLLERAREAAYLPPDAPPVWPMIEVMGRAWRGEAQGVEPIAADYLAHHRAGWAHLARVEGGHPWAALEGRILALPELPLSVAERNEPDSIRSACALWKAALEGSDLRGGVTLDEEGRWRLWLSAWVLGFANHNETISFALKTVQTKAQDAGFTEHGPYQTIKSIAYEGFWIIGSSSHVNRLWGCDSYFFNTNGTHPLDFSACDNPFTPKTAAQAAQQCFIRIPDRILSHFGLQRWQTSLGFEV